MVISMLMKKRMKISKGGQVLDSGADPQALGDDDRDARRIRASEIVLRPAPDDPIAAAAGAFAGRRAEDRLGGVQARRSARPNAEAEDRKFGR